MTAPSGPEHPAASPFHFGEQEVQLRAGVRHLAERMGRMIRPYLPEQHREFLGSLPNIIVSARDAAGRPWASWLSGPPGFVTAPTSQSVHVRATTDPTDPLVGALGVGRAVGLLGIDFTARRRNRVNGRVTEVSPHGFSLAVDQSFGNCPKHIAPHALPFVARPASDEASASAALGGQAALLSAEQCAFIAQADTFFIASGAAAEGALPPGMDVSHRGGPRGFVHVLGSGALAFPDYSGNNAFNTLGNLSRDARAGLLFVDFVSGAQLQLSGLARVNWNPTPQEFDGAERSVEFSVSEVIERP